MDNDYIGYSKEIHDALLKLYKFNYENIYTVEEKMNHTPIIREAFYKLWTHYLEEYNKNIGVYGGMYYFDICAGRSTFI